MDEIDETRAAHAEEKEDLLAQLLIANRELAFQSEEKGKRAAELLIANKELAFQNEEKEKRAAELLIANGELASENYEKGRRAAELVMANKELALQILDKEQLARDLITANTELAFQNGEKGKRAAELVLANNELIYQNGEREKRAAELAVMNQELLTFTYISNHDLQEPLRKIEIYVSRILGAEYQDLSPATKNHFQKIQIAAERMRGYMRDLLLYHYASSAEYKFEKLALALILDEVKKDLAEMIEEKKAVIVFDDICDVNTTFVSFRQLLYNVLHNSLKFSKPDIAPYIVIKASIAESSVLDIEAADVWKRYCHIVIQDNGIGFEPEFSDRIFGIFQRLHSKEAYPGTGIGLAIAKKIVASHKGFITARSKLGKGTTVDIYIPE